MKFSIKKIKTAFLVIIFLAAASFLAFNDYGIIKYFKLKGEVRKLESEISKIDKENKNLQNEIDSLQNKIPAKIEKIAREKYGMMRKGEIAVEIKTK